VSKGGGVLYYIPKEYNLILQNRICVTRSITSKVTSFECSQKF